VSLYQVGETWYVYITHEGERVRRSAGTTDKKAAQRFHDELKASLWAQAARPSGRTWQDACTAWLKAETRSKSDRYTLRALDYADRPLTECTAESFEPVLAGKTAGTANRHRALIVAILTLAGVRIKIPMRKLKAGRLRFLTEAEWKRLYATLPEHLKPLAAFSIATGLRQANVTHLRWNQVDLARQVMWIHPDQAKGGKAIGIPLSPEAKQLLQAQIGKHDEWVFPYKGRGRKEGGPVVKIKTAWQLAMERAGLGHFERTLDDDGKLISKEWVGDFTWHGLRHTWASWHVMAGTPLEVLQKLGGWEDLRMVMKYAHLAPEYLASFAGNAKPWKQEKAVA
jgi:integrase